MVVYQIDDERIRKMFTLSLEGDFLSFVERILSMSYKTLNPDIKTIVIYHYIKAKMGVANQNPPLNIIFFKPKARKIIALFYSILGYKSDEEVDDTMLGFLSHYIQ